MGYKKILCISTEKEHIAYHLFSDEVIPSKINDSVIEFIKPDCELKDMGVDFYTIAENGLDKVYNHGYEKGNDYIKKTKFK